MRQETGRRKRGNEKGKDEKEGGMEKRKAEGKREKGRENGEEEGRWRVSIFIRGNSA